MRTGAKSGEALGDHPIFLEVDGRWDRGVGVQLNAPTQGDGAVAEFEKVLRSCTRAVFFEPRDSYTRRLFIGNRRPGMFSIFHNRVKLRFLFSPGVWLS